MKTDIKIYKICYLKYKNYYDRKAYIDKKNVANNYCFLSEKYFKYFEYFEYVVLKIDC